MKPGPRPKPTHLKLLEGNPGGRRLPTNEPKPPPSRPRAPDGMSDRSRKVWNYLTPRLDDVGLLTQIDRYTLRAGCDVVAKYEEAIEMLDRTGLLIKGARSGEPVRNPLAIVHHQSWAEMVQFSAMFGLSPADRSRLAVTDGARVPTLNELLGL